MALIERCSEILECALGTDRRFTSEDTKTGRDMPHEADFTDVIAEQTELSPGAEGEPLGTGAREFSTKEGRVFVGLRAPLEDTTRGVTGHFEASILEGDIGREAKLRPILEALAEREGECVAKRTGRLEIVGMCRGRIESMGVAGVNPRVVGDESATEILPFKGVDDARDRHEHLVRVKSTVVWRIVLTPWSERPHVGRALFLRVQLTDLLAPLVTLPFAIGLIGGHTPIETEIIAVREEKVAAAQAIIGLRKSRGK